MRNSGLVHKMVPLILIFGFLPPSVLNMVFRSAHCLNILHPMKPHISQSVSQCSEVLDAVLLSSREDPGEQFTISSVEFSSLCCV